jgi:tRNA G18 (ribose-2'-O)-methylase SpoU
MLFTPRGYAEIGVYHPKKDVNIGTLWRSAYQLGCCGLFTIGRRYQHQASDTTKAWRHMPLRHFLTLDEWQAALPLGVTVIAIEMGGTLLHTFKHPERAIYLLGAEDHGLPESVLAQCQEHVAIEAMRTDSYNVAVAGSLVLYHRLIQQS